MRIFSVMVAVWTFFLGSSLDAESGELEDLCADRAAIERVYYGHRTGEKKPFAELLPPRTIEELVRQDLHKEAVLKHVYGVVITEAQMATELMRMEKTTRAPEVLKELKEALGSDRKRMERSLAKPLLVEREVRQRFADDQSLHRRKREEAQDLRKRLLKMKKEGEKVVEIFEAARKSGVGEFSEVTWALDDGSKQSSASASNAGATGGPYSLETLGRTDQEKQGKGGDSATDRFENLPSRLQAVLKAQLKEAGDISGVIEMPRAFLLCILKERASDRMSVGLVVLAKRDYEAWLREQP